MRDRLPHVGRSPFLPLAMRHFFTTLFLIALSPLARAQGPAFDPSFIVGQTYTAGSLWKVVQQADGKRVLVGQFNRVAGTDVPVAGSYSLARLLTNGTQVDAVFQSNTVALQGEINQAVPLANGQLLVLGLGRANPLQMGTISRVGLLRLNADGTPDATFDPAATAPTLTPRTVVEQPDGKLLVTGFFEAANGTLSPALVRLTTTGAIDPGFQPLANGGINNPVDNILLQADGSIIIGGTFGTVQGQPRRALARLLPTGALDTSFDAGLTANTLTGNLALQTDGKVLALLGRNGNFQLSRLLSTGAADATWQPGTGFGGPSARYFGPLAVQANGSVLVSTSATLYNGAPIGRLVRLLPTGTLDASFANQTAIPAPERYPSSVQALPNGQVLAAGQPVPYGSLAAQPEPLALLSAVGVPTAAPAVQQPGSVFDIAQLPNGQLLVGGDFTEINGQAAGYVARLNAAGTPDAAFAATCNGPVNSIAVQADGNVLLGGRFGYVNGVARPALARLLPAGTLDAAFAPPLRQPAQPFGGGEEVRQVTIQPDGNILLSGSFNLRPNATALLQVLARVLATTGQRDATFVPADSTGNFSLLVQANGRILVGGMSRALLPTATAPVLVWRLLASGVLDNSFQLTPVNATGNAVNYREATPLATDASGRIYVGGRFATYGPVPTHDVARLLPNGTPDATFLANPGSGSTLYNVAALAVQPNGRLLVAADIRRGSTAQGLTRLLADGTEDTNFYSSGSTDYGVLRLLVQANGAILAAGTFRQFGGLPVGGLVRLLDANVLAVRAGQSAARFEAWPVPAHATLHLRLDAAAQPQAVQLLNALGRVVITQQVTQTELTLNTTGFPSGIYLVRVAYAHSFVTRRVVLE